MALIEINGVSKAYALENDRMLTAIDRIALSIGDGEFVSIISPSGCGKSTLLHMIGGFVPCSAGEIRVRATVHSAGPDYGIVFQHFAFFPGKTALGNVEYGLAERDIAKVESTCVRTSTTRWSGTPVKECDDAIGKTAALALRAAGYRKQRWKITAPAPE
jgi:ABC-type nitrate/sulfonate/bicarbonate transport system ATPase subunit